MSIFKCRYGDFSVPEKNDLIFNALREYGEWAQEELNLLERFVRSGDTVIDAGAFIGTHARAFSQMVGSQGVVHAFEPNDQIYSELLKNVQLASYSNIKTYQIALGACEQSMHLLQNKSQMNLGASSLSCDDRSVGIEIVRVQALDSFDFPLINFIKADVEGMEHKLLVGGLRTIRQHKPVIFLEANSLQAAGPALDFAHDIDYVVFGSVSCAFNPDNYYQSTRNIFGEGRECGLLLIHKDQLDRWRDELSLLALPIINNLDDLVVLLLNKPQYIHEFLADAGVFMERDMQLSSLNQAMAERDMQLSSLNQAMAERDTHLAQILASRSWQLTKPLRFIGSAIRAMWTVGGDVGRRADAGIGTHGRHQGIPPSHPWEHDKVVVPNKSVGSSQVARIHHNIDHLVIKSGLLHSWGWICDEGGPLADLRLECILQDGRVFEQAVRYGSLREDVGAHLKHIPHAEATGYVASAAWDGADLTSAGLIATTANGALQHIPLFEQEKGGVAVPIGPLQAFSVGLSLGKRALRLARQRQFGVLLEKVKRYWVGKPASVVDPFAVLKRALAPANEGIPALLIIDHDLGGGAPQYRQQRIDNLVAQGHEVLLLTFHLPTLTYAAQVYGKNATPRLALPNLEVVLALAREGCLRDIFFNNAVSFPRPERIPDFLIALRSITRGRLTLAIHDFYILCPSHFLLNASGSFCNIPDPSVCNNCLQKNQEGFVNFYPARDIQLWRQQWRRLIDAADELLLFSQSSRSMLLKVYPDVPFEKLHIKPHSMEYFPPRKVPVSLSSPLHLGVVGHIGRHKGAKIVAELANTIASRRSNIKMTIFGSIDERVPKEVATVTGSYQQGDLPRLIEHSCVNLIFIPSIVPETFSYVTHEIIRMGLPVVCFNLGAQAEVVSNYLAGRVIPILEGDLLLDALTAAHESLRAGEKSNKNFHGS